MLTVDEHKEMTIQEMVKAGVNFSRALRNCWTGEKERSSLSANEVCGKLRYLQMLACLPKGDPLIDWANVADLNCFYMGKPDQHQWNAARWEQEIRARMS